MSRIGSLDNPDFALIDLDPTEGCPYSQIVEAAQLVKKTLDSIGLAGYPKTTGGDGMHIYIPLEPVYTFEQVRSFAELLSVLVDEPESGAVHYAAHSIATQEGQGIFRLPADFERQDHCRSLCLARAPGRSGFHALGLV